VASQVISLRVDTFVAADSALDRGVAFSNAATHLTARAAVLEEAAQLVPWPVSALARANAVRLRRRGQTLMREAWALLDAADRFYRSNVPAECFRETGRDLVSDLHGAAVVRGRAE
jgi:hypothetical protein